MGTSLALAATTEPRMYYQAKRTVSHAVAALGNITESLDIWSQVLVLQATLAQEEAVFDLNIQRHGFEQRQLALAP